MNAEMAVTLTEVNDFLTEHAPFCAEMCISCVSLAPNTGSTRFTYAERWTRPGGIVSGAVLMALADVAVYTAIFTRIGIVPLTVTNELKINFLRPAIGHDVIATANVLKVGQRVAYASVDLAESHDSDRLVAHATASYILPDARHT